MRPATGQRARTAMRAHGSLVPALWLLTAYFGVVVLTLWLGSVLPVPKPSSLGWSD